MFHISIHALREERDDSGTYSLDLRFISIHALREERDHPLLLVCSLFHKQFQSTRSARSATQDVIFFKQILIISIHALREERDQQ